MNETMREQKICRQCRESFPVYQEDNDFYDKISPVFGGKKYQIPSPTLCPDCRQQRRLAWKNELSLYKNSCHGCGVDIVSRFHRENPHKNYCHTCWASDAWDARDYGQAIDFHAPVFPQIHRLIQTTPFQNLIGSLSNIENNASYTNCTADIRNSYMVSESDFVENCLYGRLLRKSQNLVDCLDCSKSENCYDCTHSTSLYNCLYTQQSENCSHSSYLTGCMGCQECIGCVGLKNQKYHILNTPYTREEYFKKKQELLQAENIHIFLESFHKLKSTVSPKHNSIVGSENSDGSYIVNSKNIFRSSLIQDCEDVRYSREINDAQDIMDVSSYGSKSYKMFESMGVGRYSHDIYFCSTIGKGENLFYCIDTKKSQDCFGCVNMKFARYCIFNTQYTKEQYESLVPKIITHMQQSGEWGEFFPMDMSPFSYHESLAGEMYPLGGNYEVNNAHYSPSHIRAEKIIPASKLPKTIEEIPDDILSWAIKCEVTGKPFRIIEQELTFYRKYNIALPHLHPDERRKRRINQYL